MTDLDACLVTGDHLPEMVHQGFCKSLDHLWPAVAPEVTRQLDRDTVQGRPRRNDPCGDAAADLPPAGGNYLLAEGFKSAPRSPMSTLEPDESTFSSPYRAFAYRAAFPSWNRKDSAPSRRPPRLR